MDFDTYQNFDIFLNKESIKHYSEMLEKEHYQVVINSEHINIPKFMRLTDYIKDYYLHMYKLDSYLIVY